LHRGQLRRSGEGRFSGCHLVGGGNLAESEKLRTRTFPSRGLESSPHPSILPCSCFQGGSSASCGSHPHFFPSLLRPIDGPSLFPSLGSGPRVERKGGETGSLHCSGRWWLVFAEPLFTVARWRRGFVLFAAPFRRLLVGAPAIETGAGPPLRGLTRPPIS